MSDAKGAYCTVNRQPGPEVTGLRCGRIRRGGSRACFREEEDLYYQKNDRTTDDSISNVECPPALQLIAEKINIEKVKIKKVYDSAKA